MNDINLDTIYGKKLPIYKFDNGLKICKASLYNLYETLKLLGMLHRDEKSHEAMCWVRDYTNGYTIETAEQLEKLLLNERKRLRISFFSYQIDCLQDLISAAKSGKLPVIEEHPESYSSPVRHEELYVYTIWFSEGCNYDTPLIRKSNITNIQALFECVKSAYLTLLEEPQPTSPDELNSSIAHINKNFTMLRMTSNGQPPPVDFE